MLINLPSLVSNSINSFFLSKYEIKPRSPSYDAVYVSGGVMSNDLGYPDIGLTTLEDVSNRSKQIARVTNLPTIVDIDTGFKSCKKTIKTGQ